MSKSKKPEPTVDWRALSKLERKITADERGGIMDRWEYGREVLKAKAGRQRLPDGMLADLVNAAGTKIDKDGNDKPRISERDIQYRIRLAEVYTTDQLICKIIADLETWTAIIAAGFPTIEIDEDFAEPEDLEVPAPDAWEQLSLLPGFKPTIKLHRREIRFDEMTVPESVDYRDMYREKHEGYGKSLALIEATVGVILDGWDGDDDTKAVDAYRRGLGEVSS